jgi:hypothetical protein
MRPRKWSTPSRYVLYTDVNISNPFQRQVKRQLLEPVEVALSQPTPGMWDTVLITYREVTKTAEDAYLAKAKSTFLRSFVLTYRL